jgi:hypothetical protein
MPKKHKQHKTKGGGFFDSLTQGASSLWSKMKSATTGASTTSSYNPQPTSTYNPQPTSSYNPQPTSTYNPQPTSTYNPSGVYGGKRKTKKRYSKCGKKCKRRNKSRRH